MSTTAPTWANQMGQREDLYRVRVRIQGTDGKVYTATYDGMDGGDATAKETKYRPGNGTEDEQTLGGANSISNITVTKLMDATDYSWLSWLISQNGKAKMWISKQPLDIDGNPWGTALGYFGRLNGVNPPKTSSGSDAAATLALVQSSVTPVSGPATPSS
jgi:hypothetical protein